ncbi:MULTISPECIES: class I SAM-dependent methyltransferase [unclassified Brevundimonas]|jgi:hypothetical protein|uniref:class I SAM-dependent methyltransferase n=1 Tax=unclassified Brevundimonas TaxID=2622653 RepID=UPI00257B4FEF|nr:MULTISPECIES: hypothetical protein [unclassified Brevundimonas]|tara:strand:+ start:1112 stop:1939 length:828 start_codon:yes stop_codon:yes gene_type:complete
MISEVKAWVGRVAERHSVPAAAGLARAGDVVRLFREPRAWSELVTRLSFPSRMHQDNSLTFPERYPTLFSAAQKLLGYRAPVRILSFGCSSGEEVQSLRRYFPDAVIVGAEINASLLRACRELGMEGETFFIPSKDEVVEAHGPFDAIFCMAVFTRRPHEVEGRHMLDISRFYPFERFAASVRFLASQLTPGGLLVVEHALYRVEDALEGLPLTAVVTHGFAPAKGPRFDPTGVRLASPQLIARIFSRTRDPSASEHAAPTQTPTPAPRSCDADR